MTEAPVTVAGTSLGRGPRAAFTLLLAIFGLVATLLVVPQSASARTAKVAAVPARTKAEVSMIYAVQRELNKERAAHRLPAMKLNKQLLLSARRHNLAMSNADTMSHQLPGEAFFSNRMTAAGYRWSWAGENIAWNSLMTTAGVIQVQQLMYNEVAPNDGHRQNILNTHFQDVGIDVYLDRTHHKVWLTTDFGRH